MIRSLMSLVLALGVSSSAWAMDKAYFDIKKVTVTDVTEQQPELTAGQRTGLLDDCSAQAPQQGILISRTGDPAVVGLNPLDQLQVWVDQIINIGKKIWAIVEAGKPVVNIKLDTANALPKGVRCWTDMQGWAMPQSKVYRVQYENAYGMTVVDFSYRLMFTANGNVDGVGKYITNATFQPANLSVGWGFRFDATAAIPAVFNQGTKQDPVAGMQMNMAWRVDSPLAHEESTESYFVTGDNKLVKMK
ncbi:hypothetical protein [Bdellovibrio sp. NC01]|uniref:hypothetical protein n=1 Tax=Bdellovibrio sp. NC01 TaxID=2220073 RepID=UPI001157EBCF|nr:hypothetical protein [Bdellovibrio sp. NC01]QDK37032.1 hypothetical protein DOE51_05195 [Bdellovibrio sp. NC01]